MCIIFTIYFLYTTTILSAAPQNNKSEIKEVPVGHNTILHCGSNDQNHNFLYWHVLGSDVIIGPSNPYNLNKYDYEVLTGNLTIKDVSKAQEGVYKCFSRGVLNDNINVKSVHMLVHQDWAEVEEHDSTVNAVKITIIILSLIILGGIGYLVYKIWKDRFRHPGYLEQLGEDDDSTEEIFSVPSTSKVSAPPRASSPRIVSPTREFDLLNVNTDFNSILETANNK